MHCHPWAFISLVLWGGYQEETWVAIPDGGALLACRLWRGMFSIARRPPEWVHRIAQLHPTRQTWTLLFVSRPRRTWGFYTPGGFVDHRDYSATEHCP